jgi:hypothetical protein
LADAKCGQGEEENENLFHGRSSGILGTFFRWEVKKKERILFVVFDFPILTIERNRKIYSPDLN